MSVLAVFRVVAKEFASVSDGDVGDVIDIVSTSIDAETFGNRTSLACAYLAAHELALVARAQAGASGVGPVSSIRTGDLSVSYATPATPLAADDAYYGQTSYGLAFLQIRGSRAGVGFGLLT